jgi:three-Cys-motif partner protein
LTEHESKQPQHPDELRTIEEHLQTEHKLEVVRRYFGAWAGIIANTSARTFSNRDMYIVDTHAGAGLHASDKHPDGWVYGTPLIACEVARTVQRQHPGTQVHVRAIDVDSRWVFRLRNRINTFTKPSHTGDRVDVEVIQDDFANRVPPILTEAAKKRALSMWFIDPYGVKEIPFNALRPLNELAYGPEVIINLDLGGIWRLTSATEVPDLFDWKQHDPERQTTLSALFGDRASWEKALLVGAPYHRQLESLARAYAELFNTFKFRNFYPLRSSNSQFRFLIHLTHAALGARRFKEAYETSWNVGLFAGRALDQATRAHAALTYWAVYRGRETSLTQLYEEHLRPFNKPALAPICRAGEQGGFGHFDEAAEIMHWAEERADPQTTMTFE